MQSLCLTTMPLQDRHTASNIEEWLEEVVVKFEILASKIIATVHDNGANFVAVANILLEKRGWSTTVVNRNRFPILAKSYLCIPGTLTPFEFLFFAA